MKLFFAKCDWYDEFQDEDKLDSCFIFGNSLSDVGRKIEQNFPYINKVVIEEICEDCADGILYIPSPCENIEYIKEANMY